MPTVTQEDPDSLEAVLFLDSVLWSWLIILLGGLGTCVGGTVEILILFLVCLPLRVRASQRISFWNHVYFARALSGQPYLSAHISFWLLLEMSAWQ